MNLMSTITPSTTPARTGAVRTAFLIKRHPTRNIWELVVQQWLDLPDEDVPECALLTEHTYMLTRQELQRLRAAAVL